jgi:predicted kinase
MIVNQTLIVLAGIPFTGKTVTGDRLREDLNIPFLAVDRLRPVLFGKSVNFIDDPEGDAYQLSIAYPVMLGAADVILGLKSSCIIEGTFSRKRYQEKNIGSLLLKYPNISLKMILLYIPEEKEREVIAQGVCQRKENPSGASRMEDYFRVKERFEPIIFPHLTVDTTLDFEESLEQIKEYIFS